MAHTKYFSMGRKDLVQAGKAGDKDAVAELERRLKNAQGRTQGRGGKKLSDQYRDGKILGLTQALAEATAKESVKAVKASRKKAPAKKADTTEQLAQKLAAFLAANL